MAFTVKIEFTEEALGLSSANPEMFEEFQASRSADAGRVEEELAAMSATERTERALTVFPKERGVPFFWDYQIKGAFKDFAKAMMRAPSSLTARDAAKKGSKIRAYRQAIDNLIFPGPRKILMCAPNGMSDAESWKPFLGRCARALRASTPQGERVSLACSETVPAGTTMVFDIECLDPDLEPYVREWLDYGKYKGLSQWRNSGKGRFLWAQVK